jgi:hypothetical protein
MLLLCFFELVRVLPAGEQPLKLRLAVAGGNGT